MKKIKILAVVVISTLQINAQKKIYQIEIPTTKVDALVTDAQNIVCEGNIKICNKVFDFKNLKVDQEGKLIYKNPLLRQGKKQRDFSAFDHNKNLYVAVFNYSDLGMFKDIFILKYNRHGLILWASQLNVDSNLFNYSGLTIDSNRSNVQINFTTFIKGLEDTLSFITIKLDKNGKIVNNKEIILVGSKQLFVNNTTEKANTNIASTNPNPPTWIYMRVGYDPKNGGINEVTYSNQFDHL